MGLFVPQFQLKPQKTENETIGDQHFTFPLGNDLEFRRWLTTVPGSLSPAPSWGSLGIELGGSGHVGDCGSCPQFHGEGLGVYREGLQGGHTGGPWWGSWRAVSQMAESEGK